MIVSIMVNVMRVGGPEIFRDVWRLAPGDKWRPTLAKAIVACDVFVLFWCRHARASPAVRAEWRQAVRAGKRIVPILVDSTSLPQSLTEYHWIDVRELMEVHGFRRPGEIAVHRLVEPTHLAGMTIRRQLWQILQTSESDSITRNITMPDNTTMITDWLKARPKQLFCGQCVSEGTGVKPFQQVNQIIRPLGKSKDFRYFDSTCSSCRDDRKCVGYFG